MRKLTIFLAASAAMLAAGAASATNFSFTGTFTQDNDKAAFNFAVGSSSNVTLRTYSYAGGTNAQGQVIARGGFDPILTLYNADTGLKIDDNDDGNGVPYDTDGHAYDTLLTSLLAPGNYTVYVTQYNNRGPSQLPGSFTYDNNPNFRGGFNNGARDGHWAFDVLNVDQATQTGAVPEPASWAMMIGGFGLVGGALRRRATRTAVAFG